MFLIWFFDYTDLRFTSIRFFHKSIASKLKDIRLTSTMRSSGIVPLICNLQKYQRDYNSAQNKITILKQ